ncbi:MAG: DUF2437 domain-containing protein, partial [Dehalococcoidia bacterium]
MKYCRVKLGGLITEGVIEGDRVVPIDGTLLGEYTRLEGEAVALSDVILLAPVIPRKVVAAAVNYQSHVPSGKSVL